MIIEKQYCDKSGAFYIHSQKFRYNDKIIERITKYLQFGGAILRLKKTLPSDKIFEEFSLNEFRDWHWLNATADDISRDLKAHQVWHAAAVFGDYNDNIHIDNLGWIIRYDPETMPEADFYNLIAELAHKYACEYAIMNMPTLSNYNENLSDKIVGIKCYWGMAGHQIARVSYESILSNFYN